MPLYAFEVVDAEGKVHTCFDLNLPVDARDTLALRRQTIPHTLNISGAALDPNNASNQVLRMCERSESRLGTREFQRRLGNLPAEAVKQAWSQPNF